MATRKEIKDLRKPDEFLVLTARAGEWLKANVKLVAGAGVAVILIIALVTAIRASQQAKEEAGDNALATALDLLQRPVVESKDDKAPKDPKAEAKDYFPSDEAKRAAVFDALEKVRKEHAGSAAAATATFKLAQAKGDAKDAAGAAALYEEYLKLVPAGSPLVPFAIEGLGYAQEGAGKLDDAAKTFDRLGAEGGDPALAAFHHARLLAVQGKRAEAKKAFEQVATDYAKEPIAGEAWTRAELLAPPPYAASQSTPPPAPAEPAEPAAAQKPAKPAKKPVGKHK